MKRPSSTQKVITLNSGKIILHRRSVMWIGLAVLVFLMAAFIPDSFFERWYYGQFFRAIRISYDFILGWLPFPMIYMVAGFALYRTIRWFGEWKRGFFYQASRLLGGIAWVVFFFYALWGFNYHQRSLQDRLGFHLEEVGKADIEKEFHRATEVLNQEARNLPEQYKTDNSIASFPATDHDLRDEVESALRDLQLPVFGRVRVRQLWPKGLLLRWSTAGIYIPHALEGHIDKGLISVQKPFSIAHEMAHGYGITDEGACNFIAWLACSRSNDPWVRYCGALTYWRYAAAEMPDDAVEPVFQSFDPVVIRSLELIRINDRKYPDLMPQIRDAIYSSYLKQHGVKGGLRSYNYVVMMVSLYLDREDSISN